MVNHFKSVAKYLAHTLLVLWLVLTCVHLGLSLASGNPVDLLIDNRLSAAQRAVLEKQFGYDASPLEQYGRYLTAAIQGDFGISFLHKAPVAKVLFPRMGKSILLGSLALFFAFGLAFCLLVILHRARQKWLQRFGEACLQIMVAVPAFVWAPILLAWLARSWGWFPAYGSRSLFLDSSAAWVLFYDSLTHAVLPALCLALPLAGQMVLYLHEQILALEHAPFVLSARGRGVKPGAIFWNHQVRRVAPSLVQWMGLYLPILAGGAVVIEAVFGWPGLGLVLFDAVLGRDYPLLMAGCIWMTCLVVPSYQWADWLRKKSLEVVS